MAAVSDESAAGTREPMAPGPLKPVIPEGKTPAIRQRKAGPLSWVTRGQPTNYNMVRPRGRAGRGDLLGGRPENPEQPPAARTSIHLHH